ncbi:MAG TPA: hypothetical protein VIY48_05075 [Candidatus Paceibacterota bacterium]
MLPNIASEPLTEEQRELILRGNIIALNTDVTRMKKTLYEGDDGKILPVMERLRNIEAYIDGQKFWIRTIAVALVLQTIGMVLGVVFYFVKLYPVLEQISRNP